MASNGTIINDFRTGYRLQIVWTVNSQDVANNTSNVTATVQLVSTGSAYNINSTASKSVSLTINGVTYSGTCNVGISGNQTKSLFSQTVDVPHNSDGTKTCSFSCSLGINVTLSGTYWGTISASGSGIFNTIPRASSISSFPNFNIDGSSLITISRASDSFTHTLELKIGSTSIATRTGIDTITTLTLTAAEQDKIYQTIPNSTSITVNLYCTTYSGSTIIGDTTSKSATASVPSTIIPTFTTITHSEANSSVSTNIGVYVQSLSILNLAITGATGAKFSTIKSYKIDFDDSTYNTAITTTGTIKGSGSLTITGTITDSRGRTSSKSVAVTVLTYSPPKIVSLEVVRCYNDGSIGDGLGTYAKVISTGSVTSLKNGTTEKNSLTYKILSKDRTITTWTTKKTQTLVNLSLSGNDVLGTYGVLNSFDFRLEITDKFYTQIALDILGTGQVVLSLGKTGVGIGKVWEQGVLDVGGDIYESGTKLSAKYSVSGHTHSTYALTSHGYHVPTPQIANDAVYLRNDNTWQTITPNKIGGVAKTGDTMTGTLSAPTIKTDTYGFVTSGVNGTITGRSDSGFDFNLAGGWRITFDGSARCIYTYNPNGGVWTRIAG